MQERLQRVPLYLYMFAISLAIVALVNVSVFTLTLASVVILLCVLRVCESPTNTDNGIVAIEEQPRPARNAAPEVSPESERQQTTAATPDAIKFSERTTDPSTTNGRGFTLPVLADELVFTLDDTSPPPAAVTPEVSRQQNAAAIAAFFAQASQTAPAVESAPAEEPQKEIPADVLELTYMAAHTSYINRHPSAEDALPRITGQTCQTLDEDEQHRWRTVITACEKLMASADEKLREYARVLGLRPASSHETQAFARMTRQMLMQLDAGGRDLDRTLDQIFMEGQRKLHRTHAATHEVMVRDEFDYTPGAFPSIPRVRGCPTLPSQGTRHQLSAGYRAGSTPAS